MNRYRKPREGVETLVRMQRWPNLVHAWVYKTVRIYSSEHRAFWRGGGHGYTAQLSDAGVFSFGEAYKMTHHCGPEKRIEYHDTAEADRLREGAI